ncbi:hypothetical protein BH20ACT18_BH20ACT18_09840 [soil metagenome]
MWAHMGEPPPIPSRAAPNLPAPFDEVVPAKERREVGSDAVRGVDR